VNDKELNIWLATEIMGWTFTPRDDISPGAGQWHDDKGELHAETSIWKPTTDARDALTALDRLKKQGYWWDISPVLVYLYKIDVPNEVISQSYSTLADLPRAISEAIVEAVKK